MCSGRVERALLPAAFDFGQKSWGGVAGFQPRRGARMQPTAQESVTKHFECTFVCVAEVGVLLFPPQAGASLPISFAGPITLSMRFRS